MKVLKINPAYPQDFMRVFHDITNLFFEDTKIAKKEMVPDLEVHFTHSISDDHLIKTAAELHAEDEIYRSHYEQQYENEGTEREQKIRLKRALSHVLLDTLEQMTEIKQQWGILTGIRPTKLYHKFRKAGLTDEEIHQKLVSEFSLSDEKIDMLKKIVQTQLKTIPDLDQIHQEVSIYIGIPFCPTKCAYCTFPAYAIQSNRKQGRVATFLDGLHYEIEEMGKWLKENNIKITSVYFGGGTPTSIEADEMDALYKTMFDSFPYMEEVREITVEAGRPDTITEEKLEVLKKWGIDRISVNPQSYTDETLKAIGRHHSVQETIDKFWMARKSGMNNINMDLIIGLPNEGLDEFEHSIEETEKMMPESLTVHTLSFKRASEMTHNKEKYKVADRKTAEAMMHRAHSWTEEHGYTPYYLYRQKNILGNLENVGYSLPGEESIYNIAIMEEAQTIIGLGCGASTKLVNNATGKINQYHNPKEPAQYILTYQDAFDKKIDALNELYDIVKK